MVELFGGVVRDQPAAPAVRENGPSLSYADLDAASDELAARLYEFGVRRGDLVGLLLGRSAQIPIAILAVLKVGAAYVPLDPTYPSHRLRYIVEDAGLRTVVAESDVAPDCGPGVQTIINVHRKTAQHGHFPPPGIRPEDPAYVIYTSGSTGDPKGCLVSHANVLSLLRAAVPLFDVGAEDRWALFHSFSFDVSVWEFWAAMSVGAEAVVIPLSAAQSPAELIDLLVVEAVTVLGLVPSVFRAVVLAYQEAAYQEAAYQEGARPTLALRYLIFAGESVDLEVIADFVAGEGAGQIIPVNMYGPTETTVYVTHRVLGDDDFGGSVRSPIGWALSNTTIEICDDELAPLPDGEVGEMLIAGGGVALGYLNRPELTAERFVVRGPGSAPVRYYRTGDLARRGPDGSLEFLGRRDAQVKLRGYRIELGEIETVLRRHRSVRDVAVTVIATPAGAQFLVACIVVTDPAHAGSVTDELRSHALTILPRYMVPDRYRVVAQLPLTGSGKLDRAAVQALARAPRR